MEDRKWQVIFRILIYHIFFRTFWSNFSKEIWVKYYCDIFIINNTIYFFFVQDRVYGKFKYIKVFRIKSSTFKLLYLNFISRVKNSILRKHLHLWNFINIRVTKDIRIGYRWKISRIKGWNIKEWRNSSFFFIYPFLRRFRLSSLFAILNRCNLRPIPSFQTFPDTDLH